MLEWRSERIARSENQQRQTKQTQGDERVTYTDNLAAVGIRQVKAR